MLIVARAVQGIAGAVVSAVALSLIMDLFTEPAERAKAMGIYGFVCAAGGSVGVLLGGMLTSAFNWHWIFLVNLPIGIAVYALLSRVAAGRRGTTGEREARRRRRGDGDGGADARRLRDRQWQRAPAGHRCRRSACSAGASLLLALFLGIEAQRARAADAARPVPSAQRRDGQRRRRAVGGGDVRVVLHLGAVPAARARLQRRCRSASRSCRRT